MVFPCTWSSRVRTSSNNTWAFLVARRVKNLPAMQEAQVWPLVREDSLEKGMATHSTILAWRIPWTEEPGGLQPMGLQRVRHDWATNTHKLPFAVRTWTILRGVWGRTDTSICMAESLCYSPEITTISLINYTPIQNKRLKKNPRPSHFAKWTWDRLFSPFIMSVYQNLLYIQYVNEQMLMGGMYTMVIGRKKKKNIHWIDIFKSSIGPNSKRWWLFFWYTES